MSKKHKRKPLKIVKPYRPSNGTEGEIFQEQFCYQCKNDSEEEGCDILLRSMVHQINEPEYPTEWIYDENKQPVCTAFEKS